MRGTVAKRLRKKAYSLAMKARVDPKKVYKLLKQWYKPGKEDTV